jgi:DNA-binding transcriptional LysR family regulator
MVMYSSRSINFRTLDLNLLRVFDTIMTEQSLTRASITLSLTQPAVSNALRRLREHLGDDLLVREGQKLIPTPLAKALWPSVRDALSGLELALAPEPFVAHLSFTSFVLTMADATSAELIPSLSHLLEQEAPNASLRIIPLTTRDPRSLLLEDHVDFAVGYFPAVLADLSAQTHSDEVVRFEHLRLFEGEYVCVMRKHHPLSQGALSLEDFCNARHMLVSYSGRPFGFVDEALSALGRKRRVVVTVNQFATAGRVVLSTDLITVLPRHFVKVAGLENDVCLVDLPMKLPPVHIDLLWSKANANQARHLWLKDALMRASTDMLQRKLSHQFTTPKT